MTDNLNCTPQHKKEDELKVEEEGVHLNLKGLDESKKLLSEDDDFACEPKVMSVKETRAGDMSTKNGKPAGKFGQKDKKKKKQDDSCCLIF